jgi:hypothetical protein
MKRIIIVAAMLMMFFTVPAFATDGGMYNVKYMAANPQEVYNQIAAAEYPEGGGSISKPPAVLDKDMTAYVSKDEDTRTVTIHVVMPTFEPQAIPAIQADSQYNQSIQSLVDYVYQYRELKQTSSEYEEAMGAAPIFELNKYSLGSTYNQLGKTYTLTQMYMEQQITQTLVVNTVYNDTPRVDIDSNGRVHCSPETVQYSKDRSSWSTIKDGAAIPSSCYGESVYFRTPANAYAEASDYIRVYVREQQSAPTTKLELSSTSFSVTVDNASEFSSACEFSIDGTNYSSKTEWTNLDSKTNYTVYVRYEADSSYFASAPLSASITTKEGSKNETTYEKSSNAHTTYFVASGTTRINVSNKTMSATYTDSNVSRLKSDIKDVEKRMSAVTVLDVTMEQEEGDNRDFNKVKFSMPKDLGLLQLRLKTPYCTIIVSDSSTNLEIESISKSTKTTGLKDFVSGKDLVYKVTTKGDGSIEILYPWEFPDRADLSGLRVNYIDTKYKSSRTLPYQVVDNGIIFTMPDDGYFSITNLHRNYGALPFSDCQTHWAYSYIYYAYENGLINGISDTEFSPDTLVTRSQIAVLLARLAGVEPGTSYETPYTDVDPDSWYGWAVGYLYSRGVLKDQGDGLFGPDESITREQMAALVGKLFPYRGTIWRPMNCTDRDQISTYALNAVDGLYNRRVFEGDEKGNFNPNGTLTRGEFTAILYRLAVSVGAV